MNTLFIIPTVLFILIIFLLMMIYHLKGKLEDISLEMIDLENKVNKYQEYTMVKVYNIKKEIPEIIQKQIGYIEFSQPLEGIKKQ
tara:strand:- start:3492 stop:3746 length:255 start_codon:yes stop_codon:yes gene_type:complete